MADEKIQPVQGALRDDSASVTADAAVLPPPHGFFREHRVLTAALVAVVAGAVGAKIGMVLGRMGDTQGSSISGKMFAGLLGVTSALIAWDANMREATPVSSLAEAAEARKKAKALAAAQCATTVDPQQAVHEGTLQPSAQMRHA